MCIHSFPTTGPCEILLRGGLDGADPFRQENSNKLLDEKETPQLVVYVREGNRHYKPQESPKHHKRRLKIELVLLRAMEK